LTKSRCVFSTHSSSRQYYRVNLNLTFKDEKRELVVFLFYLSIAVRLVAVSPWILRVFSVNTMLKLITKEDLPWSYIEK
jgi:hypothetical protein